MAFDQATRNKLQKFVSDARALLAEEFSRQLQNDYGMDPESGTVSPIESLPHLTDTQHQTAKLLRETMAHYQVSSPGNDLKEILGRIVREQAFTVLNRLCALRMAEARGILIESIAKGYNSKGFQLYAHVAGTSLGETGDTYRNYLFSVFDEFSIDLAVLFDRYSPMGRLFPKETALLATLEKINAMELESLWAEDETIGWIYQYFNPKNERDAMRKASRSPMNTREMAVRNQFFTPRYVVEFLTDNTLGYIWYEMRKGETALKEDCCYLVRRPNEVFLSEGEMTPAESEGRPDLSKEELLKQFVYIEHRSKKDPRDFRVLDPACGSGHFLLYAFELLEQIYEEAWSDPESPQSENTRRTLQEDFETLDDLRREIPKLIMEHNLHGIDIDPRAVQIAALALWLRAQKTWKNLGIKAAERAWVAKSNIVTAEPMPGEKNMKEEFTAGLKPRVLGQLVDAVFDKMKLAGEAGSLLKIEEEIKEVVAEAKEQWLKGPKPEQQLIFPEMGEQKPKQQELQFDFKGVTDEGFWKQTENRILDALRVYSEKAENGEAVIHRLFAEDAAKGFAFIDLCRNRYDVILMNPPFGAASRESKEYIEVKYPDTKGDVLANFIERTLHLATSQGRVGAISSRTPFFLGSFEGLRTEILGKVGNIRLLADLGEGVLEAMVETAIYVVTKERRRESESLFFRLLIETEKGELLKKLTKACLNGDVSNKTFVINPLHFGILPGNPYAYWVSKSTIETVSGHPNIEGNKAAIRVGMQTGDDFRFLRCLWEISPTLVSPSPAPENKHSVRQQCLKELSSDKEWVPFSKTETASPWFSPITLAAKWSVNGHELRNFTNAAGKPRSALRSEQEYFKPGFSYMLRSTRLVPYLVPSGVIPTAGRAQIFPDQGEEYSVLGICASNVGSAVARFSGEKFAWPKFQASMVQGLPSCEFPENTIALIKEHVDGEVNKRRAVVKRYEPYQEFSLPAWIHPTEYGETVWDLYSLFGRNLENKIAEAFGLNTQQLVELERDIREAVSIRGHAEDIESKDAAEDSDADEQELNVELISETPEGKAVGLLMYAVGVAFGRWDIRFAIDPSLIPKLLDPFDPLPVCPPGMLVRPDGLPAEPNNIVSEEWLRTRPSANTLPSEDAANKQTIHDSQYPFRISWPGIIVDGDGHPEDITTRIRETIDVISEDKSSAIEQEACEILGVRSLREYFGKPGKFFADHLKRYSKSRRQAPIYWPLSTSSGSYTLWLYYHRLTDQTLYTCINKDFLGGKLQQVADDAERLRKKANRSSQEEKDLEKLSDLERELIDFHDEILRIARFWKPNLNDGVQITAAPLWKLFQHKPWQTKLKQTWKDLEKGNYDWANLAYSIWPDRVIRASYKDRSYAIAHDLEADLWEEVETGTDKKGNPKTKWVPKDLSEKELKQLIAQKTAGNA